MDIDFVIYWVDGSDINWQKKKAQYKSIPYKHDEIRYRDWGILKYWFRSVEKHAPWVHKIYFVTDNQCPVWLNKYHPKIELVNHTDFIPQKFLPTFQSHTIELNIHRIKGLSEYFVLFNDDMYINNFITSDYYFHDKLPCDGTYEHIFSGRGYDKVDNWGINIIDYVNTQIINANFARNNVTNSYKEGWYGSYLGWKYQFQSYMLKLFRRAEFQHFYTPHNEKSFLKSVYKDAWENEPKLLAESCTKFRENMNLSCYFIRYWQLARNKFYPRNILKERTVYKLQKHCLQELESLLFNHSIKSLCINDTSSCTNQDFIELKPKVIELLEHKFPYKSSYEV